MIKILVVDDSPTMRLLIRSILESDPEMRVVGEARNGEEAVALAHKLQPDVVTMDIRMPKMNGYEAIQRIMADSPRPIVVLTSTMSDRELGISFKAIDAGALTVVGKPRYLPDNKADMKKLVGEIKAMAGVKVVRRRQPRKIGRRAGVQIMPAVGVRIIAIGASTGGPPALHELLGSLPASLAVPVVVVQHISPGFVGGLARWLDEAVPLRVKVTENGEFLKPGTVYLAPDDRHLLVSQSGAAALRDTALVDGHRPSVTMLFESIASNLGSEAVGVLLTGMGRDGARGLKTLREAGGRTFAQSKASCVVFGMPGEAKALGAADMMLPLDCIAGALTDALSKGLSKSQ